MRSYFDFNLLATIHGLLYGYIEFYLHICFTCTVFISVFVCFILFFMLTFIFIFNWWQQTEDLVFDDSDDEDDDEPFNLFSNSMKKQTVSNSDLKKKTGENKYTESNSDSNSDSDSEEDELASKKPKLSRTSKSSDFSVTGAKVTPSQKEKSVNTNISPGGISDNSDSEMEDSGMEEDDDELEDEESGEEEEDDSGEDDSEEEREEDEDEGNLKWKTNIAAAAAESFKRRQTERINYRKLIYGTGNCILVKLL